MTSSLAAVITALVSTFCIKRSFPTQSSASLTKLCTLSTLVYRVFKNACDTHGRCGTTAVIAGTVLAGLVYVFLTVLQLACTHVVQGENGCADCESALHTLYSVLFSMVRVMAPFTPFLTEQMYQNLQHLLDTDATQGQDTASVHYLMLPQSRYIVSSLIKTLCPLYKVTLASIKINVILFIKTP